MENVLFWTLCIGSALMFLALAAQAIAGIMLLRSTRSLRGSVNQLMMESRSVMANAQRLMQESRPQLYTVLDSSKDAGCDLVQRVARLRHDTTEAINPLQRSCQKLRALFSRRTTRSLRM